MKRIGILTLPLSSNYGGILQAYALCHYLMQQGHEVILLNYQPQHRPMWKQLIYTLLTRLPKHNLLGVQHEVLKIKRLKPFIQQQFPKQTPILRNTAALKMACKTLGLEVLITGSDQVWRYAYTRQYFLDYFLGFIDERHNCTLAESSIRKLAYAASFGVAHWEAPQKIAEIQSKLADFTAISVRESSALAVLSESFQYHQATQTVDPTLLHSAEFYRALYLDRHRTHSGPLKLISYVLDPAPYKQQQLTQLTAALGQAYAAQAIHEALNTPDLIPLVSDWLKAIDHADYVVTDSFHGVVFAVIFQKNFLVFANPERGNARIADLLQSLGLSDCMLFDQNQDSLSESIIDKLRSGIDYSCVTPKLARLVEHSKTFLKQHLAD